MGLSVTSWPQAVSFRVAYEDNVNTTIRSNVLGSTGVIRAVVVDNSQGSAACYLKIADAYSASVSTEPHWVFRVGSGNKATIVLSDGGHLSTGLTFWATRNAAVGDNNSPSVVTDGSVKVVVVVEVATEATESLGPTY